MAMPMVDFLWLPLVGPSFGLAPQMQLSIFVLLLDASFLLGLFSTRVAEGFFAYHRSGKKQRAKFFRSPPAAESGRPTGGPFTRPRHWHRAAFAAPEVQEDSVDLLTIQEAAHFPNSWTSNFLGRPFVNGEQFGLLLANPLKGHPGFILK